MCSRLIPTGACVRRSFLQAEYEWLSSVCVCACVLCTRPHFVYPFIGQWALGCFRLLAIRIKMLDIGGHIYLFEPLLLILGVIYSRCGLTGSDGSSFNTLRAAATPLSTAAIAFSLPLHRRSSSPRPHQHLLLSVFLITATSVGVQVMSLWLWFAFP